MTTYAMQQAGFDFGDSPETAFNEDPPGTWLDPRWSSAAYRTYFKTARQRLAAAHPLLRSFYRAAIDQAIAHLKELDQTIEDDGAEFTLPRIALHAELAVWQRFAEGCAQDALDGAETIARQNDGCAVFAAHVEAVGSLIARRWSADSFALDYQVGRDPDLRTSFNEDAPTYPLPEALWHPYYAGHRLAEAGDRPAHLRAFSFQARRYVVTGMHSRGGRSTANAWSIVAETAWCGPNYTYRSQYRAWDEGRKERGDERGLRVVVDRLPCVLDGYTRFVDTGTTPTRSQQRMRSPTRTPIRNTAGRAAMTTLDPDHYTSSSAFRSPTTRIGAAPGDRGYLTRRSAQRSATPIGSPSTMQRGPMS